MQKSETAYNLQGKDVYAICFPDWESAEVLQDELASLRKAYFSGGRKPVHAGASDAVKGFSGKVKGKLARHSFYWKKSAGKQDLEESFDQPVGHVVLRRSFSGVATERIFFDKDHAWIKAEYYKVVDPSTARVIFKPSGSGDWMERFDWDESAKHYTLRILTGMPYLTGTATQSILNSRFGQPNLIVSTGDGDLCFCPEEETAKRLAQLEQLLQTGAEMPQDLEQQPEEEPQTADLPEEPAPQEELPAPEPEQEAFSEPEPAADAEQLVELGAPQEERPMDELEEIAEGLISQAERRSESPEEEEPDPKAQSFEEDFREDFAGAQEPEETSGLSDLIRERYAQMLQEASGEGHEEPALQEEKEGPAAAVPDKEEKQEEKQEPAAAAPDNEEKPKEDQPPKKAWARTQQPDGKTVYEGEMLGNKRQGFGAYYDKNGALSYAGFWDGDKKDGMGVSFRGNDHALHISRWEQGQPGAAVSLFDGQGRLRYSGEILDGKKEGAGVSWDEERGLLVVEQWRQGEALGRASVFDREGRLLYSGGWLDGKRQGRGLEFSADGEVFFAGEWKNGERVSGVFYQKLPEE